MPHSCFLFPLSKQSNRLSDDWCPLSLNTDSNGSISWYTLRTQIAQNYSYSSIPLSQLNLIIYTFSDSEDLHRHLESDSPIDLHLINQLATRVNPTKTIPVDKCKFVIAIGSSVAPLAAPSSAPSPPTLQSVLSEELPAAVQLPKLTTGVTSSFLLSEEEMLPIMLNHVQSYKCMSLEDCKANDIETGEAEISDTPAPEWVKTYIEQMSRRREIPTEGFQYLFRYASNLGDPSLPQSICDRFVCNDGDSVNKSTGRSLKSRFLECTSYSSMLVPLVQLWYENQVLDLLKATFAECPGAGDSVGGQKFKLYTNKTLPSKLGIPIESESDGLKHWYIFNPNAALFRGLEPFLFVEVESKPDDYATMLLYGASLVKWLSRACHYRFILPLLFVYNNGKTELLYMYELDDKIQVVRQSYDLNRLSSRLELFVTLSNIIDREPVENLSRTLATQIPRLTELVIGSSAATNRNDAEHEDLDLGNDDDVDQDYVPKPGSKKRVRNSASGREARDGGGEGEGEGEAGGSRTRSASKRKSVEDEGVLTRSMKKTRAAGDSSNAKTQVAAQGSKAKKQSDAQDSNTKTPAAQDPKAKTQTVTELLTHAGYYHTNKVNGKKDLLLAKRHGFKFVVKIVRKKSERKFYNMQLTHPNIIKPEEIISTSNWYLAILPELVPLDSVLAFAGLDWENPTIGRFRDMSYDLANGLQFLHDSGIAHMDINPNNLVYHRKSFVLQIIDFNSAAWVKDLDETVTGRRGTVAWMAPEVSQDIPYNPILADRYSCGIVFHHMARAMETAGGKAKRWAELGFFARQLMSRDPCLRPALNMYPR